MKVIHFFGYKGGGKTRAISYVARALASRGLNVGTLKHVDEPGFTVDRKGKDSWVHANSGAKLVAVVSAREFATIEKRETSKMKAGEILNVFAERKIDYVLVEGLSREFSQRKSVIRILCARSRRDAVELMGAHGGLLCIIGGLEDNPRAKTVEGVPVLLLPRDGPRLLHLMGQG